jgi:hypothetical protein
VFAGESNILQIVEAMRAIEALLDKHQVGRHDHGKKLWALYILFAVARRRDASVDAAAPSAAAAH